jgi:YYY domain-containing protein
MAVHFKPGPVPARSALLGVLATGVVALSWVAFLPFHQAYEAFNTGLDPSKWRTPIDRYLGIYGLFIFIVATFLIYRTRDVLWSVARSLAPRTRGGMEPADGDGAREVHLSWLKVSLGLGLLAVVLLAVAGYWTAAMLLGLMVLTGLAVREVLASGGDDRPFVAVPLVLLGLALAIGVGVDLVRLEGDIGRMNTLFKYYLEVWMLLGLASAYMIWHLGSRGFFRRSPGWSKGIWLGMFLVLIGSSLVYTGLGTRERLANRFNTGLVTLDGAAYMQQAVYSREGEPFELKWDLEAIRWLQDNVAGSPVVLEAHNEQYNWSSRMADYTGLPTVLGWPWHQTQQRMAYGYTVRERAAAVREIYNTTDLERAQALLRQYEVEYIVVGGLERIYYSEEGLQKFAELSQAGLLKSVFRNDGVHITQHGR